MARSKPRWLVFEGGPRHGQQQVAPPAPSTGAVVVYEHAHDSPLRVGHEYRLTGERRTGPAWPGKPPRVLHVAEFVRTLPPEPVGYGPGATANVDGHGY